MNDVTFEWCFFARTILAKNSWPQFSRWFSESIYCRSKHDWIIPIPNIRLL